MVLLQHNEHVHPQMTEIGAGGNFSATNHGVGNFGFKIILTAPDNSDLEGSQAIFLPMPPVGKPDVVAAYSFNEVSEIPSAMPQAMAITAPS